MYQNFVFDFQVGDTLRYFNAFHSSKSWCCVGDDLTPDAITHWIDRDLLVTSIFEKTLLLKQNSFYLSFSVNRLNHLNRLNLAKSASGLIEMSTSQFSFQLSFLVLLKCASACKGFFSDVHFYQLPFNLLFLYRTTRIGKCFHCLVLSSRIHECRCFFTKEKRKWHEMECI